MFCPRVEYIYFLDGQECTGNRIFFGSPEKYSKGEADRIVRAYPVGQEVSVTYDPEEPESAALKPGLVWEGASFTLSFAVGGALLLIGSTLAIVRRVWKSVSRGGSASIPKARSECRPIGASSLRRANARSPLLAPMIRDEADGFLNGQFACATTGAKVELGVLIVLHVDGTG